MNGEESEAEKIISSIQEQAMPTEGDRLPSKSLNNMSRRDNNDDVSGDRETAEHESDVTQYSESGSEEEKVASEESQPSAKTSVEPEAPRRRSTRPKKNPKER